MIMRASASQRLLKRWTRLWMRYAGLGRMGRMAMRLAALPLPPGNERIPLSYMHPNGFIEHTAIIRHPDLILGKHVFIDDRVIISERRNGGRIQLDDAVEVKRDSILETGVGGQIHVCDSASIHPNCHIFAYVQPITIGKGVMIAPSCALYSFNHGIAPGTSIRHQPLESKGPIVIGDEAWIGTRVTVLHGVTIGKGAIVGAGSVVMGNIPDNAIAGGVPAEVLRFR